MEHLVESHLGGYYVSSSSPDIIEAYCDECGDHDYIFLSWKEGQKYNVLKKYFSDINIDKEKIENYYLTGLSKTEMIDYTLYHYQNNIDMISILFEEKIITSEQKSELDKIVKKYQKEQINLILELYPKEKTKTLKNERGF